MSLPAADDVPNERRVFATNLRQTRKARAMSQAEICRLTNIDKSYFSDIERLRANPSLDLMAKIANVLQVELYELLRPR